MNSKIRFYIAGLAIGIFFISGFLGIAYSLFQQRAQIGILAKNLYLLFSRSKLVGEDRKGVEGFEFYPGKQTEITINPEIEIGKISPLLFGANLSPKMESEPDIIRFIKDINLKCFRFPGGGSPGYHWKDSTFDFDTRNTNAPLRKIDYLLEFCRLTNTSLVIQVNVESGTAKEAAEWVEYMNKKVNFPVIYWELGNEVYGDWDKGYMSPEEYAALIKEFSREMKKVDPDIKIGMDWAPSHKNHFNKEVVKKAGEYIDFISYHWYPNLTKFSRPYKGRIHPEPKKIMANYLQIPYIVKNVRDIFKTYQPQKENKVEIAFLEWDGAVDGPSSDFPPYSQGIVQWSLANAIFYADCLGIFALNNVSVSTVFDFQSIGFGFIRGWDKNAGWQGQRWDGETIRPKALALKLFARHFGDIAIQSEIKDYPYYYKMSDWYPDSYAGKVPYLSCYASKYSQGNTLTIVLTNKHEQQAFKVKIHLKSVKPKEKGMLFILSGPELLAQNEGNPLNVGIKEYAVENVTDSFGYTVPAHSVVLLKIDYETKT